MEIRYITVSDDRLAISKVYEESWKYAYKGIIPQDYLDSIPEGQWASHIEQAGRKNLVMLQDGIIIGTSGFSKSRMAEMNDFGEIISLYFLPEYMGKGYGKLLLQAAVSELKKMGFDKVFLWVLEENQNARHFYEKCGFVQTERCLYSNIGGKELKEVQYCYQDYMTEIHLMTAEHTYWKETISFAERCSWNAGSFLAKKMQENEFKEWERVCVVCVNGKVAGFSAFTERDELSEQYDFTPFIGFIFVDEQFRGRRLSEMMIQSIISYAKELGYEKVYIMSGEIGLYEKYGFVKSGDYETIYGSTDQLFVKSIED